MDRIWTIIDKEWAEVFKNRMVLFTIVLLPLLFTALPLGMLWGMAGAIPTNGDVSDVPPQFLEQLCKGISTGDCFQYYLLQEFMLMFMLMPFIIPIAIAAYSVVGEKTTRSLEPLLATPITTVELLTGKSLAAVIPAVAVTWAAFLLFIGLAPLAGARPDVLGRLLGPVWLLAIFAAGPFMAVVAVNMALIVSSRVNDPRVAEQISAVVVVPLMGLVFGQLSGMLILNVTTMLIALGVLILTSAALIAVGASLFQRETILTRWK